MEHWHLAIGGVEAPRPRHSDEITWDTARHPKLSLRPCSSPVLHAPGRGFDGLCEKNGRRFGWTGQRS